MLLTDQHRSTILAHCHRKLARSFLPPEPEEIKAYGLLGGIRQQDRWIVKSCDPLLHNARQQEPYRTIMDRAMTDFATPSVTPLAKRGWVADPNELMGVVKGYHRQGWQLIATYHMHRVGWAHDPVRDLPTALDNQLAATSGLVMLIISMVDPDRPIFRAFFEGDPGQEIPLTTTLDQDPAH